MKGASGRFLIAIAACMLGAAAVGVALRLPARQSPPRIPARQTKLLLLTSLPILFNENFGLKGAGSPAFNRLRSSYRLVPISVADAPELSKGELLLMAQPFAQTPENLVALDSWVRRGGRVLLLADPLLEWPSERPLGDLTRPQPMFADTGLLGHWGIRLDAPDERGIVIRQLGRYRIATVSPGRLSGACTLLDNGLEAKCRVGRGRVFIIADADFLNTPVLGREGDHNLDALIEQLASLADP